MAAHAHATAASATVSSSASSAPTCDEGLDVELRVLGPGQDPEGAELRLLAQLETLGYAVERLPPDDDV